MRSRLGPTGGFRDRLGAKIGQIAAGHKLSGVAVSLAECRRDSANQRTDRDKHRDRPYGSGET